MLDLDHVPTTAADQVMVVAPGGFVHEVSIADVRYQSQAVLHQKIKRAVYGRFRQPGQALDGALVNRSGRQVTAIFFKHLQDRELLWGQAVTLIA